jgi:hypothetical protein
MTARFFALAMLFPLLRYSACLDGVG